MRRVLKTYVDLSLVKIKLMKPKARRSARTARKGKTAKLSPDEQAETNQNEAKSCTYLEIDIPDPTKEVNLNLEQRNLAPKQEAKSTRKSSFDRSLRLQMRQVHLFALLISAQFMSKTFNTDYFKVRPKRRCYILIPS